MILISHRGNINGPQLDLENLPSHIQILLNNQINVEIDVWYHQNNFYLGHDKPVYKIDCHFLLQKNLWCHAKNLNAFEKLIELKTICFWHNVDDYTLTTNNFIWTYPNKPVSYKSIIVDTSINWKDKGYNCSGVCVDYLNI
jgi:hypothetical protein